MRITTSVKIAAGSWLMVLLVFCGMCATGFDMIAIGAIPVAIVTAPWSALAIAYFSSRPSDVMFAPTELNRFLNSTSGTFLVFVVISGGLNVLAICAVGFAIQRLRKPPEKRESKA